MSKKSFVPGTDIPYENWIQAWIVSLREKRKKERKLQLDKKILYIDMDSVLVDFIGAFNALDEDVQKKYDNNKNTNYKCYYLVICETACKYPN